MGNRLIKVERDGWFIDIETLDISERPNWEIRCRIRRSKEERDEERGHRFFVSTELSERYKLAELSQQQREALMTQAMLTHVYMKKGCLVPMHHHENEQITYVLEGALKFWVGSEDAEPIVVRTGEVLVLPSNVPHKAEALEDTLDVDVFSPPRRDWLEGTDDYLRQQ